MDNFGKEVTFSLNNSADESFVELIKYEQKKELNRSLNRTSQSAFETIEEEEKKETPPDDNGDNFESAKNTSVVSNNSISAERTSKRRKTETRGRKSKSKSETKEEQEKTSKVEETKKKSAEKEEAEQKKPENQELWTEKYQFKNEDDIVTNNSQLERLKEWLNNWKAILSKDSNSANPKSKYNLNSSCDSSDTDYACDSDYSASDSVSSHPGRKFYSNAVLLSGPHGCGKTSSVHSVAKQLGFKVFEVNSSSLRCKSQIIQELEGALNSHHVSNNSTGQATTSSNANPNKNTAEAPKKAPAATKFESFFKLKHSSSTTEIEKPNKSDTKMAMSHSADALLSPSKNSKQAKLLAAADAKIETKNRKKRKVSLRKETVLAEHRTLNKSIIELDDCSEKSEKSDKSDQLNVSMSESSSVNIHKESLILFDEIDVVFKEDVGFWSAINHFIKKSKKPIVLTTNDDYLQDKLNLNIEKIEFTRPRIDASIRFLKMIAKSENKELNKPIANKILRECKCDIRKALVQLQFLISSSSKSLEGTHLLMEKYARTANGLFDLNKFLSMYSFSNCKYHNERNFFDSITFLDALTKLLLKYNRLENDSISEGPTSFKKYDLFIIRDGLTDHNSSAASSNSTFSYATFNPFIPTQSSYSHLNNDDVNKSNTIAIKDHLYELYETYMTLFNDDAFIEFSDWSKHGAINQFNFSSNVAINKFAQSSFKFTSNNALSLDYRPFLQQICQMEELKAVTSTRRRYLHYLSHLSIGLNKEDYPLLARSNLIDRTVPEIEEKKTELKLQPGSVYDEQIFSSDEK